MTGCQLYWLLKLDDIQCTLSVSGIFLLVGFIVASIMTIITSNESYDPFKPTKRFIKCIIACGILGLIFASIAVFLPSTKQMAVILVAPKIINNEQVQKIPNKVVDLANEWLDELKPKGDKP